MRVLVTGGSGFLGVYLSRLLLSKKCTVTLLDRQDLDASDLIGKVHFIKGDVRNPYDTKYSMLPYKDFWNEINF